jgi:hypothetical protein
MMAQFLAQALALRMNREPHNSQAIIERNPMMGPICPNKF